MKQLTLLTVLLALTINCICQTPKKKYHWSNYHGPRKVEYFKLGDTLSLSFSFAKAVVIKPKQLNKQYAYYEQGYGKHFTTNKLKRIFKRNCKII